MIDSPRQALAELDELAGALDRDADELTTAAGLLDELDPLVAGTARRVAARRRREATTLRELRGFVAGTFGELAGLTPPPPPRESWHY